VRLHLPSHSRLPRVVANHQGYMERLFVQAIQFRSSRSITRRRCFASIIEDERGNEANLLRYGVRLSSCPSRLFPFHGRQTSHFSSLAPPVPRTRTRTWTRTRKETRLTGRFTEMPTSRFVESAFWNFDSMFVPQQHPAREVQDTFYVKSKSKSSFVLLPVSKQ